MIQGSHPCAEAFRRRAKSLAPAEARRNSPWPPEMGRVPLLDAVFRGLASMLRRRRTGPGLLHSPRPRGHGAHGTVFTVFWMAALAVGGSPTPAADKGLFDEPEAFQVFAERSPVDCLEFIETHREGLTTARHRIHAEIFASIAHRTLGAHAASLEAATRAARLARTDGDVPLRLRADRKSVV